MRNSVPNQADKRMKSGSVGGRAGVEEGNNVDVDDDEVIHFNAYWYSYIFVFACTNLFNKHNRRRHFQEQPIIFLAG